MIRIVIPEGAGVRRLPFYLAVEEWAAKSLPPSEYFFAWRVAPTVICGRNQDVEAEVDLAYCREQGIDVVRRKSGGGCVFADMDNLMISYVAEARDDVATTFARYTSLVAGMLRKLGIDAQASGRNDITIAGRKVSGNAFYRIPGRYIAHGTMLFSTDMAHMLRAITPARAKLESKRVASVESRITTLREHMPALGIADFADHLNRELSTGCYTLSPADLAQVEAIEQGYREPRWLGAGRWGKAAGTEARLGKQYRVEGAGTMRMGLALDADGRVADAVLQGDFFALADIDSMLGRLRGALPAPHALLQALGPEQAIAGLDNARLAELLAASA